MDLRIASHQSDSLETLAEGPWTPALMAGSALAASIRQAIKVQVIDQQTVDQQAATGAAALRTQSVRLHMVTGGDWLSNLSWHSWQQAAGQADQRSAQAGRPDGHAPERSCCLCCWPTTKVRCQVKGPLKEEGRGTGA